MSGDPVSFTAVPQDTGPMVWHGWGDPRHRRGLDPEMRRRLTEALGPLRGTPPVALDEVRAAASTLTTAQLDALAEVVGSRGVRVDREARIRHAGGRSYSDLVRRRRGDAQGAPDAVVLPANHAEVQGLLEVCSREGIAVVPFGGGTSVVGGVEPERGGFAAVVALSLAQMDRLLDLDEQSQVATFEPGIRGADAEARLRARRYTLGHFPQSHAYATLGGYVATRSAGQASTGYGRIDDLVVAARCATPAGELRARHGRRSAAGPDLLALLTGSEGVLGVLTEVSVQVRAAPKVEHVEGWAAPSFASGAATVRDLAQAGAAPDIVRLSDESETAFALGDGGTAGLAARYLDLRRLDRPALLILGWDGTRASVARRREAAHDVLRRRRIVTLGRAPGTAWERDRFHGPYLRDDLLDAGVMVDTLETAAPWAHLGGLYLAVRAAIVDTLVERGTPPLVLCHISHVYRHGASLYFTWLARQEADAELEQWAAVKRAAGDAIVANLGTITHHHAVGRDHRPWLRDEIGDLGVDVLHAVKGCVDPSGILNPGKLLPPRAG